MSSTIEYNEFGIQRMSATIYNEFGNQRMSTVQRIWNSTNLVQRFTTNLEISE
jgi:hypothetical protein